MTIDEFKLELQNIDINVTEEELQKLDIYCKYLIEYNNHTNLTAITDQKEIYLKHFYDSLTVSKYLKPSSNILDFGTGAGFPGLVLAIFNPDSIFTLVDSVGKKTKFLTEMVEKLNLSNTKVITSRVEDLPDSLHLTFDYIVVRAVAKLSTLLELSSQLLKIKGQLVALKSTIDEELSESKKALKILGFCLDTIEVFNLPLSLDKRTIIIFNKDAVTNKKYPREFKQMKKNPL